MTTLERVAAILKSQFEIDASTLTAESRLDDLDIDSLGVIEIMFAVEDEFGITVPREAPDEKASLTSVGDLVGFIDRLVEQQRREAQAAP